MPDRDIFWFIPGRMRLMPVDAEPQLVATVEYIFGVLNALGIRNGAIHSEVKIEDRGPGALANVAQAMR